MTMVLSFRFGAGTGPTLWFDAKIALHAAA
jgi:hypothetical protein